MTESATEAKTRDTREWIASHVRPGRRCIPPKGKGLQRKLLRRTRKSLLHEELEAENSGVCIPAEIRWLGGAKVWARYQEVQGGTSSVVAVVPGEAVFDRLCKSGARLFGRRYEVDANEETRPDAFCSLCCAWGHM